MEILGNKIILTFLFVSVCYIIAGSSMGAAGSKRDRYEHCQQLARVHGTDAIGARAQCAL